MENNTIDLLNIIWVFSLMLLWHTIIKPLIRYLKQRRSIQNITAVARFTPTRCSYCHDEGTEFACTCGAYYHIECWNELSKCATLGCNLRRDTIKAEITRMAHFLWTLDKTRPAIANWLEAEKITLTEIRPASRSSPR